MPAHCQRPASEAKATSAEVSPHRARPVKTRGSPTLDLQADVALLRPLIALHRRFFCFFFFSLFFNKLKARPFTSKKITTGFPAIPDTRLTAV